MKCVLVDVHELVRVEHGQAQQGKRIGRYAFAIGQEFLGASELCCRRCPTQGAAIDEIDLCFVIIRRVAREQIPPNRGPRSSENSEFNSNRACGAMVDWPRCGQLAVVSGRSNASKMGNRKLRRAKM